MCLIIQKPQGRHIASDFLENAWQRNADGWGCFHVVDGELRVARGLSLQGLIAHNAGLPLDAEVYLHLRRATRGEVNHDMTHPFVVRPGLLLMHNGNIDRLVPQDPAHSDTFELARLLKDMLKGLSDAQAADMLRSQGFRALTEPLIDGSMVVLMDALGPVRLGRDWHTVAAAEWSETMDGVQVSNANTWGRQAAQQAVQGLTSPPERQHAAREAHEARAAVALA